MTEERLTTDEARQGQTGFGMRWVLLASVGGALFIMGIMVGVVM